MYVYVCMDIYDNVHVHVHKVNVNHVLVHGDVQSCTCMYIVYLGDGYITRPVLKPSDGFKAGRMA